MDRYEKIREDIQQILSTCESVITSLDEYERNPIPSKQFQLDVHLSGAEIQMYNMAKSMRERLLS